MGGDAFDRVPLREPRDCPSCGRLLESIGGSQMPGNCWKGDLHSRSAKSEQRVAADIEVLAEVGKVSQEVQVLRGGKLSQSSDRVVSGRRLCIRYRTFLSDEPYDGM